MGKGRATRYAPVVSRNNDASPRIESSWESRGRVTILIQKLNFPRLIMRYVRHFLSSTFCQTSIQGGHALVALYTDGAMPLHKVTCIPRGHALGVVSLTVCLALRLIRLLFSFSRQANFPKMIAIQ
jgi:Peptidase family M41